MLQGYIGYSGNIIAVCPGPQKEVIALRQGGYGIEHTTAFSLTVNNAVPGMTVLTLFSFATPPLMVFIPATNCHRAGYTTPFALKYLSASSAAIQPLPAAVTAWR